MKKNYILCGALIVFGASNPVQAALYGKILNLAKFAGASLSVAPFWSKAYAEIKYQPTIGYPMPDDVEAWTKSILEKCNDENLNNLSLYMHSGNGTAVNWWTDSYSINTQIETIKEIQKNLAIINNAPHDSSITDEQLLKAKKVIAAHAHIVKHEAGHNSLKHKQRKIAHLIVIPLTVQTACSSATIALNHMLKITPPKNFLRTGARSFVAIASCIPKMIISNHYIPSSIEYEKEADSFACDHATNSFELEAARDVYFAIARGLGLLYPFNNMEEALEHANAMSESEKNLLSIGDLLDQVHAEYDPYHPTPLARAHFIQEQIDKRKP